MSAVTTNFFSFRDKEAEPLPHGDRVPLLRSVGGNTQNTGLKRRDRLARLIAFEEKPLIACAHGLAVGLQPTAEGAFFHRPTETRHGDFSGHSSHSARKSRMARATASLSGTTAFSSGGLYGV